ncbi:MAG: flagellar biosynthetic protein FliO [Bdellovibrionales bacterium]
MKITAVIMGLFIAVSAGAAEDMSANSDEAILKAAEQLLKQGATTETIDEDAPVASTAAQKEEPKVQAAPKEADIPLKLPETKEAKTTTSFAWRLLMSGIVVLIVGGISFFALRRWGRPKDKPGKGARIEMLHQFHLGPRKSIGLIRVAGETILVGITEQSINMLKPVTLIDDELEDIMKRDFNGFLEDDFSVEDVRTALDSRV